MGAALEADIQPRCLDRTRSSFLAGVSFLAKEAPVAKTELQRIALEKAQAYKTPDPHRRAEASRKLTEARIASAIERALAGAPALTPSQVKRLSILLRAGGAK